MTEKEKTAPVSEEAEETGAPDDRRGADSPQPDAVSEVDDGASGDDEAEFEFRREDECLESPRPPFGGPPRRWDRF